MNPGIGEKAQEKETKHVVCTAWGLVVDCAFPPFWLWLSLSLGNSAQAERGGGGAKKWDRDGKQKE